MGAPVARASSLRVRRTWATRPALRKFKTPQNDIPKDDIHQQQQQLLHVFEYMNKRQWYEVNPVLRLLSKFDAD